MLLLNDSELTLQSTGITSLPQNSASSGLRDVKTTFPTRPFCALPLAVAQVTADALSCDNLTVKTKTNWLSVIGYTRAVGVWKYGESQTF